MNKQIVLGIIVGMMTSGTWTLAVSASGNKTLVAQNSEITNNSSSEALNKKKIKASKKAAAQKARVATKSSPKAMAPGATKPQGKQIAKYPTTPVTKPVTAKKLSTTAQNTQNSNAQGTTASPTTPPSVKSISAPSVISTPVSTAASSTKKSPFGFKYQSYNAMDLSTLEGDRHNGGLKDINGNPMLDGELRAWDRFNFSYSLSPNISVSIMPQLYHTWFGNRDRQQDSNLPGLQQPYSAYIGDTGLYFVDSKVASLAGGINMDFVQAYFLPTSEASQDAGQIGVTRTAVGFSRSFGPVDLKWTESLWYYFQQMQTSSLMKTSTGLPVQNLQYRVWSLLDIGLNVTKKFAVSLEAGFMNQMQYADDNPATARQAVLQDNIVLDPEVSYAFSDHFSLAIGIWELYDMRSQSTPSYTPLASSNGSEGYFQTTVKF